MANLAAFDELPPHLRRLVPLTAGGMTNAEIAGALNLRPHTVENYASDMMRFLEAEDRFKLLLACQEWMAAQN